MFADAPFLFVAKDWSNFLQVITPYIGAEHETALNQKQIEVAHYWQHWIFLMRNRLAMRVDRNFREVHGKLC